jgi:acetylornithine deacetylase/succinyl-diaminopimelate desuccinylase-like protein
MGRPDPNQIVAYLADVWERDVIPALCDYTRIPDVSPVFDPGWEESGHLDRAADLLEQWSRGRSIDGMTVDRLRSPGRTPVLLLDIPATRPEVAADTVLLYGHLDKQPEMTGWRDGLGPWEPVREGDLLYGRGVGDDGYAIFSALTAIEALRQAGGDHARCLALIEASEESGSPDLPFYMAGLVERVGRPSLVIGLDAGCESYDRLWVTSSMRGLTAGVLKVEVLREGVHSGMASGIVPSSFRILRSLLDRVEDAVTGEILLPELHGDIPDWARAQAAGVAAGPGDPVADCFPFVEGARPVDGDATELELNATWRPTLSYIGMEGLPPPANAGNVLRPSTSLTLSFRLPPDVRPERAADAVEAALTRDAPYGARVTYEVDEGAAGWASPGAAPWLQSALDHASQAVYGQPAGANALGGTIPFMAMLGEQYPDAQFCITGVMGPGSNAHGPNEFLHLPMARQVTACVAHLLADHVERD